eukprot:61687-Amphidinium_carterae.2
MMRNPDLLEKEKKRFAGGEFRPGPHVREGSTPPPTPAASSTEKGREAQRAESVPEDPSSRGRRGERPPSTDARPRDPSSENRGPDTVPKAKPPPKKAGPTMSPEEQQRKQADQMPKATMKPPPVGTPKPPPVTTAKGPRRLR